MKEIRAIIRLQAPLRGTAAAGAELGVTTPTIRTALRTGDSTATERARILRSRRTC